MEKTWIRILYVAWLIGLFKELEFLFCIYLIVRFFEEYRNL